MVITRQRFERIRVDKHWIEPTIPRNRKWAEENPWDCPPENLGTTLSMQLSSMFHVAAGYYLADDLEQSRAWGHRLVSAAEHYFFGEWRQNMPNNPYHPKENDYYAKGGGNWMTIYRTSFTFALALDHWDDAKQLSTHPTEEKSDASPWVKEVPWYLLLAEYVLNGMSDLYEERLTSIREGKSKLLVTFAESLDAIAKKKIGELDERFDEQMKHYLRSQKKRDEMGYKLALDGTILYHLARRGTHEITMDDFNRDHLIIFDKLM